MTTKVKPSVLADTAVTLGTYGGSTQHAVVQVDQQGRLVYAGNATPSIATSQLTGTISGSQLASGAANTNLGYIPYDSANPSGYLNTGLGYGQSWTNYAGSRSSGVTYTNSTGKPIQFFIQSYGRTSGTNYNAMAITINGTQLGSTLTMSFGQQFQTAHYIVPPGQTYKVDLFNGILADWWYELR